MIEVEMRVRDDGLIAAYKELCRQPQSFIRKTANKTVRDSTPEILSDFQREPPKSDNKINWTSPKQHRYVMLSRRRGIIRDRESRVSGGWKVVAVTGQNRLLEVSAVNEVDASIFVEGIYQQDWLAEIGWLNAPDVAEKWSFILEERIEKDLIDAFKMVGLDG